VDHAFSSKFENCAVCDKRRALKMLYFHFEIQSNFISFRKLQQSRKSKAAATQNYDDFLIKQRSGNKTIQQQQK